MRLWFGVFVLLAGLGATMAADTVPATGGNITLTPMTHAHVQVEYGGKVIHVDPTMQSNLAAAKPADIIIVTDVHGDHMDAKAIDQIDKPTTIYVAPNALAGKFPGKTEILKNGETRTIDGVSIQAVAAYNLVRGPAAGQFFHEKGRANAYVLTLGGKRIFFSGVYRMRPRNQGAHEDRRRIPVDESALHDAAGGSGRVREGVQAGDRLRLSLSRHGRPHAGAESAVIPGRHEGNGGHRGADAELLSGGAGRGGE